MVPKISFQLGPRIESHDKTVLFEIHNLANTILKRLSNRIEEMTPLEH
jgi:hypothetical protein